MGLLSFPSLETPGTEGDDNQTQIRILPGSALLHLGSEAQLGRPFQSCLFHGFLPAQPTMEEKPTRTAAPRAEFQMLQTDGSRTAWVLQSGRPGFQSWLSQLSDLEQLTISLILGLLVWQMGIMIISLFPLYHSAS